MKEIPLTQGKVALVDDADYERLARFKWQAKRSRAGLYAVRSVWVPERKQNISIRMHREILGITDPSLQVDHIDADGLNNQRNNLRACTPGQNQGNLRKCAKETSSRFKGVSWNSRDRAWRAQIQVRRQNVGLGYFKTEEEAAKAYDKAAAVHFGEFARLNFTEAQLGY